MFSVLRLVPETAPDLIGFGLLTTGIENAFAASGDMTKEVLPKSPMHLKGKYMPL